MFQCSAIVKEYLQCDKDTVYDAVHLLVAFDLKDANQDVNDGKTTLVIRYKTPCIMKGRGPFILSFALGDEVSLRYVLELYTILSTGETIILFSGEFSCTEPYRKFLLL